MPPPRQVTPFCASKGPKDWGERSGLEPRAGPSAWTANGRTNPLACTNLFSILLLLQAASNGDTVPTPPFRESRSPYGTKCLFSFLQTPYLLVVQASLLIHLISALPAPQPVAGLSMDHRIHPFSSSGERHGRRETGSSSPQATVDNPCHMSLRRACGHDFGLPIRCKSR